MPIQTVYWALTLIALFVVMFIIIPPNKGPELSPFGFWLGLIQAVAVLGVLQGRLRFFRLVGDPTFLGIPLLSPLCWIPPAILFAYFFPRMDTVAKKIGYIMLFATGTALAQYGIKLAGMWESAWWGPLQTFILALVTHSLMTLVLIRRRQPQPI